MHTGYEVRTLTDDELSLLPEIWAVCFDPFDLSIMEGALEYVRKEKCYHVGAFLNGGLRAVADVVPFKMHIGDAVVKCGGIAGVGTLPSDRRRGLVKLMLQNCLGYLYEQKVPVSALWPFSYPFYERMGWAVTDMQPWVDLPIAALPDKGSASAYTMVGKDDPRLQELNDRWAAGLNLSLRRNANRWHHLLTRPLTNIRAFVHADGYMLWDFARSKPGQIYVREWCYLTKQAFVDGLSLLKQSDSQADRVTFPCVQTEDLLRLGATNPAPRISLNLGMMTRVVHPGALADALGIDLTGVSIIDPLAVSNTTGDDTYLGPGELMQVLTGFWSDADRNIAHLHRKAAQRKAYSNEKF